MEAQVGSWHATPVSSIARLPIPLMHVPRPSPREQWHAVLLALLCSVMFLGEALIPGRALVPFPPELGTIEGAVARAEGMDPDELYRGAMCMGDKYSQSLAWDRIMQDRMRSGEIPLWTKDIAGGATFVPQMAQVYQPWNLMLLFVPSVEIYGYWYLLHQVLFGWLAYRFFRRISCSHGAALLGVVASVLGLWTQCRVHHNVVLTAALSLWPMLSAIHAIARGGRLRDTAILAIWTGLTWMSGFVVIALQISYLCVGFALLQCLTQERGARFKSLVWCGLGMGLGAVLSSAHMLPVLMASQDSGRPVLTLEHLVDTSLEWDHVLSFVWPDLFAWAGDYFHRDQPDLVRPPLSTLAFFRQAVETPGYNWVECAFAFGIVPLACVVAAFCQRQRRWLAIYFGAAVVFALGLATGTDGFTNIGRLLPGLMDTNAKRNVFMLAFAATILAVMGADRVLAKGSKIVMLVLAAIAVVSGVAMVWLWSATPDDLIALIAKWGVQFSGNPAIDQVGGDVNQIIGWMKLNAWPNEAQANLDQLRATFTRTTIVAVGGFVALFLREPRRVLLLIFVTMIELLHAGHGAIVAVESERVTTPPAIVQPVFDAQEEAPGVRPRFQRLGDPGDKKATTMYWPNFAGFQGIEDLAAYNPLPPARQDEFFLAIEPDEKGKVSVTWGGAGISWFRRDKSMQHPMLDVMGVRYFLSSREVTMPNIVDRTPGGLPGPHRLYERTSCLPRATFVPRAVVIADKAERLAAVGRADRDVKNELILEDPDAPKPSGSSVDASVEIVSHVDEEVVLRVTCEGDGYLRLADPYDAGWIATVDGEEVPVYPADHYLRAVYLEKGEHDVVFSYRAGRVVWPQRISLLALLIIGGLWIAHMRRTTANMLLPPTTEDS